MHALRDTTLSHVHTLIGHLADQHGLAATYRILARRPNAYAWGAIRLSPSLLDGGNTRQSRRTSFVKAERSPTSQRSPSLECAVISDDEHTLTEEPTESKATSAPVIVPGYTAAPESNDDEDDDEAAAEALVRAEVEKRALKEGSAFVFRVKDQLSLVLV